VQGAAAKQHFGKDKALKGPSAKAQGNALCKKTHPNNRFNYHWCHIFPNA